MLRALLRSLGLGLLLVTGAVLTPASAQETAASPSPGGVAFDLVPDERVNGASGGVA